MVLEHRYGATLLGLLLTGDPAPGLGDDADPVAIRFQAAASSPVDDLVVDGRTADGDERRLSIGVRRAPRFVRSDASTGRLLESYLRVVVDDWKAVRAGRWRLALAVASPNPAVQQVGKLSEIARAVTSEAEFRAEVSRSGRTNQPVRDRLPHLDALVQAATESAQLSADVRPEVLTWRLLAALRVQELRLEGPDESDRTAAVARLRSVTDDGTMDGADRLFSRLAELAARYAVEGAHVTERQLRRDLTGVPLARSPHRALAWQTLDGLADRLRDRTGFRLRSPQAELEFERKEARKALATEMATVGEEAATLVVVGEPDVGKTSLTLRAAEHLVSAGGAALTLSVRDLPQTMVEFESLLGGPVIDVFAATASGGLRLLVMDGAESVLEGREQLVTEVSTAALRAGLGVVAVTRRDAASAVARSMASAGEAAEVNAAPRQHEVLGLTATEVGRMTQTFPALARIAEEPAAGWLLGRPGLVDLLLRAAPKLDLPAGALSEADVFAVIWHSLVRGDEVTSPGGPSPDARERALTSLARQRLLPEGQGSPPDAQALPSLRSDGLLLSPDSTVAWNPRDDFATDLVRDLSVARLLITEGFALLDEAGAPRWALRAVRIACQASFSAADDTEAMRSRLHETFTEIAARHGRRWEEVPLEAMLTLGSAEEVLARSWPALLADGQAGLQTVLRLALQRYAKHEWGDPIVLAPLVRLTYCGDRNLGQGDRYARHSIGEQIRELVLAWLRGLVKSDSTPLPLRQDVRDRILARTPEAYDEFAVEALATLGPDLNEPSEAFLRSLAEAGGAHLAPAVEHLGPVLSMSSHRPDLLLVLAEAYYVDGRKDEGASWSANPLDDGIRHHRFTGGFGGPMVAWYFGPFFRLLNTRPQEAIALINRMLDHAAAVRVGRRSPWDPQRPDPESLLPGLDLDLPGLGPRRCVGDAHVWSWYRGSSVGPYACMSALLATERFADYLVDELGIPMQDVVKLLLRDCHNLAMPGLVAGLLVRHPDHAGSILDGWLAVPDLWQLEFSRVTNEGVLHVQGADPSELTGRDRRRYTFRDVVAEMTLRAMIAKDQDRLGVLSATAQDLVRHAAERTGPEDDDDDEATVVQGWAALFRAENYHSRRIDDGSIVVEFEQPKAIASKLADSLESLTRGIDAWRLQTTYARLEDRVAPVESLLEDLRIARDLAENPIVYGPTDLADPIAAVAAAAVVAHAQGHASLPADELTWAVQVLVEVAVRPRPDGHDYDGSFYSMGSDRSAAAALPATLLPAFDDLALDRNALSQALRHCAGSGFDEVRSSFAHGLTALWAAPCDASAGTGDCRHTLAWAAVLEGLRECRLGDWDQAAQRRAIAPLSGPYEDSLATVETEQLLVNRLSGPLVAAADAARSVSCVADAARRLLVVLFDAQRRGWDHWAREGYGGHNDTWHAPVIRVLLTSAVAGDGEALNNYVRAFASNPRALEELLRGLTAHFTYDETLRRSLADVWRQVLGTALDEIDAGADLLGDRHWSDGTLAALLPTPRPLVHESDFDSVLERARRDWLDPDDIADLVVRWLVLARGEPKALDALARLSRCASDSWQATTGLAWAEMLADGKYLAIANRCSILPEWLQAVHAAGRLDPEGTTRWRRIVDGLAAEGDTRFVSLQLSEE